MDQFGAGGGGGRSEIGLFDQHDLEAASGGIASDTRAIDAAADDQQVDAVAGAPAHRGCHATARII
jgi:hypothetical protein